MKIYNILTKIGTKVVRFFFIIFALLFAVGNLFSTVKINNLVYTGCIYEYGITINVLLIFIILTIILIILVKNHFFGISEKILLGIFLAIAVIVSTYWLITNDYFIANLDDAYNIFVSASTVVKGDYSPLGYITYLNMYPNNIGLFTYEFILIKLFGEIPSLYVLRSINIVFMVLGYFYLYKITDKLFNNKIINCTLVYLMFFSGQYIFYSFFAYGNCISYSTAIISVYYLIRYIKEEKNWCLLLSCLSIIVSIVIKMNSAIVLVAEVIYLIHHLFKSKKIIIIISIVISLLGTYCGTTGLQKFWSAKGEINYDETKLPMICWIAYGMNYDESNPGHYFPEFEKYHWANNFPPEYTALEAKRYIKEATTFFTENPLNGLSFYYKKFLVSWTNPQFEAFDQYRESKLTDLNKDIIGGNINSILEDIWDATLSLVAIGVLLFLLMNRKDRKLIDYIGCVVVIGGFLFHIVWEVKAIYLYQYYMYLLPYAAYGLTSLNQKNTNFKQKSV